MFHLGLERLTYESDSKVGESLVERCSEKLKRWFGTTLSHCWFVCSLPKQIQECQPSYHSSPLKPWQYTEVDSARGLKSLKDSRPICSLSLKQRDSLFLFLIVPCRVFRVSAFFGCRAFSEKVRAGSLCSQSEKMFLRSKKVLRPQRALHKIIFNWILDCQTVWLMALLLYLPLMFRLSAQAPGYQS